MTAVEIDLSKGSVRFGADGNEAQGFVPFISITTLKGQEVRFDANLIFPTFEMAYQVATQVYHMTFAVTNDSQRYPA